MRLLPPLVAGLSRWVLPMAGGSANAVAQSLLADDASAESDLLAVALAGDPPLVLWTVCVAGRKGDFEPRCVGDVARWLAQHALEVLQWEPGQYAHSHRWDIEDAAANGQATGPSQLAAYADRVADGVLVAEVAARLAAEDGQPTAELAFLLGLLHNANDWLAIVGDCPDDAPTCLPRWLDGPADTPAAAAVRLAGEVLAGEASLPDRVEVDLEACRRLAAEARGRWSAPAAGLGDRLPVLAARLARLAALENRFQETVETEKLEAMAQFAAGAGHEINNPLTVIAGRAQLFLREEEDPERRRALALINAQANRAHEMIADMMLFARPPKPEPVMVDLLELVDQLVEDLSARAARQETSLCRAGAAAAVQVRVDPTQLTVALRAMCQNALEAIGRGGRIEISVQPRPGHVEISVSDDGPGISPEARRHLFDPYYSARQAGRGLGLGLSKSWRIVTNHGGRIDVDSQPGRGTVLTITLPQHPA